MTPPRPSRAPAVAVAGLVVGLVAGCSGDDAPDLSAAPGGGSPACAAVVGRVPGTVLDRPRTEPQADGVAAWGDPPVVLRCGVDVAAGPSSDPCLTIDDVDWLWTTSDDESGPAIFVTYGRTPAVQVVVPGDDQQGAADALVDLRGAVAPLPASKHCQ